MPDLDFTLALDEGRRAFDQQAEDITRMRDRAAAVLGFGGLVASFLGGLTIRAEDPLSAWTWSAIISFVLLAGACIALLWPRKVSVATDPTTIVAWSEVHGASRAEMERDLALRYDQMYTSNKPVHRSLMVLYGAAVTLLAALILFLVIDLWSR